jgi:hypothetical protein
MPASLLVTRPPMQMRKRIDPAQKQANRCSAHRYLGREISGGKKVIGVGGVHETF